MKVSKGETHLSTKCILMLKKKTAYEDFTTEERWSVHIYRQEMQNAKQTPLSLASLSSFMMLLKLLGISAVNIIIIAIYFT